MKERKFKPIKLLNPLNQEIWMCRNYNDTQMVEGIEYVTVFKAENQNRQLLMRKDALRRVSESKR